MPSDLHPCLMLITDRMNGMHSTFDACFCLLFLLSQSPKDDFLLAQVVFI